MELCDRWNCSWLLLEKYLYEVNGEIAASPARNNCWIIHLAVLFDKYPCHSRREVNAGKDFNLAPFWFGVACEYLEGERTAQQLNRQTYQWQKLWQIVYAFCRKYQLTLAMWHVSSFGETICCLQDQGKVCWRYDVHLFYLQQLSFMYSMFSILFIFFISVVFELAVGTADLFACFEGYVSDWRVFCFLYTY